MNYIMNYNVLSQRIDLQMIGKQFVKYKVLMITFGFVLNVQTLLVSTYKVDFQISFVCN